MEGFTNNKNVANYEMLAKYYDYLLQDEKSLDFWLEHIESKPFKTCLELASGSGVMLRILKSKGYEVIGSDISESMKLASRGNYDGEYLILDMSNYELKKNFDLVLCICDSINYLSEDELNSFFVCAYKHLNKDGRLIFDMHNEKRIEEFKKTYIEEGKLPDGSFYQWTINSDPIDYEINEHFTFYIKNDMIQEHHTQHVFKPQKIKEIMDNIGFKVTIYDEFVKDEKVLIIGEKQ